MINNLYRSCITTLLAILGACFFFTCGDPPSPELVFHNGRILTMRPGSSETPAAVHVRDGVIVNIGNVEEVFAAAPNAQRIDLHGAALLPGFIAPHTHPELSAYLHTFVDLSGFTHRTPDQVWDALRAAVAEAEPGEWVYCRGFDPILIAGLSGPTRQELDEIAPENPVVILAQSLHTAWANSPAFAALGIDANTPDPGPASYYEKNDGGLSGMIVEVEAMQPFMQAALPTFDIKKNFQGVLRDYSRHGITSIGTAGLFGKDDRPLMMLRWLSAENPGLLLRTLAVFGFLPEREPAVRNFVYLKADSPFELPESPEREDTKFQIIGIKMWYDGSPYTGSMYLREAYKQSELMQRDLGVPAGSRGSSVISRAEFRETAARFHGRGWQLAVHTQGDQAALEVVEELREVLGENPRPDHRHRLEHGLLIPKDVMPDIAASGLNLSYHINHLYYYGEALRTSILGEERAEEMLAVRSALDAGVTVTLHADQPMYPEDPLSLIATAVNRKSRDGHVIGVGQAISVSEALRAVTIDAAWQLGMETKLGSIEVGKYADFVVLDRDPRSVPNGELRKLQVLETYVGGVRTYAAGGA